MSSTIRKPEFRLQLGYPNIIVTRADRAEPVATVAAGTRGFATELRALAPAVARGALTVVLPETEVWRGRAALPGISRLARRRAARELVGRHLRAPAATVEVTIGAVETGGLTPVAGVRRSTLAETRRLMARVGLRPSRIVGAGEFPGFAIAPSLDGRRLPLPAWPPRKVAALGAGGLMALAALALAFPRPVPAPVLLPTHSPVAALPEPAAPPVTVAVAPAPPKRLALLRSDPPAPRPEIRTALGQPAQVTLASRSVPLALVPSPEGGAPRLRLAELPTARARTADGPAAPAPAPAAAPTKGALAVATVPRPMQRPRPADVATAAPAPAPIATPPAETKAGAETAPAAALATETPAVATGPRPMHRPRPATAAAPVEAASVKPAPVEAAALPAAAPVSAADARPRARPGLETAALVASLAPVAATVADFGAASAPAADNQATRPEPRAVSAPARKPESPAKNAAPAVTAKPKAKTAATAARPKPVVVAAKPRTEAKRAAVATKPKAHPVIVAVKPTVTAPVRQAAVRPAAPTAVRTAPKIVKVTPQTTRRQEPVRSVRATEVRKAQTKATKPARASTTVASAKATQRVGLSRGDVSLIGVFGGEGERRALLRLPNGKIQRVSAGDRVQGVQVAAVGADSVQLRGRGRDTVLRLPD